MSNIVRAIIETLGDTPTLDDVEDVCNAVNLYFDCKEDADRDRAS